MPESGVKQRMSDEAIRAKTGKTWDEWFAILDAAGARDFDHKGIVAYLHEHHGVGPWWTQGVTVGYEQARGMRQKHQKPSGFEISRSKTLGVPLSTLFAAFDDQKIRVKWLKEPAMVIRKSTRDKSMRITWVDGETDVTVNFYSKGDGKSQVALQHSKLKDAAQSERMKTYWGEKLEALQGILED